MHKRVRAECNAGIAQRPHILVKTHAWSDDWDPKAATHIFLTHRDLRGVLASYQRVEWAFDISQAYVKEHMLWRVRWSALSICGLSLSCSCAPIAAAYCGSKQAACTDLVITKASCEVEFLVTASSHAVSPVLECGNYDNASMGAEPEGRTAAQDIAQHDFAFEDIVSKPAQELQTLAQELGIQPRVSIPPRIIA